MKLNLGESLWSRGHTGDWTADGCPRRCHGGGTRVHRMEKWEECRSLKDPLGSGLQAGTRK